MNGYDVKQASTAYPLVFLLIDSSDHIAGKTGLSPTVTLSKNGGAFASPAGAVTEIGSGWYRVAGNATDTATLGPLILHATATGADPCDAVYPVVSYDPQDAVRLGLSALPSAAAAAAGGLLINGTNAGPLAITGLVSMAAGLAITQSTVNGHAVAITGNGTGSGMQVTGGASGTGANFLSGGAGGNGLGMYAQSSTGHGCIINAGFNGHGLYVLTAGSGGNGLRIQAGTVGNGISVAGGTTSGHGFLVQTTNGDAIQLTPTLGHGLVCSGAGASKYGIRVTSTLSDGINVVAGTNSHGMFLAGIGTGAGLQINAGATGTGVYVNGGTTSGSGMVLSSAGSHGLHLVTGSLGAGLRIQTGATGAGIAINSGSHGITIGTTSGDAIQCTPTGGHGLVLTANGTDKHGLFVTGGTAGISDGVKLVAGTGGVQFRGDITGTLTTVTTLTGYTTPPSAVEIASLVAAGPVASVTAPVAATIADRTGFSLAATGLDAVSTTAPIGVAANFREMMVAVWRLYFKPASKSTVDSAIRTFADNGTTVLTTQPYTDDGNGNETRGSAT